MSFSFLSLYACFLGPRNNLWSLLLYLLAAPVAAVQAAALSFVVRRHVSRHTRLSANLARIGGIISSRVRHEEVKKCGNFFPAAFLIENSGHLIGLPCRRKQKKQTLLRGEQESVP